MLGDVDLSVVVAAMGWFQPDGLREMWDAGIAVTGAREAARPYGAACGREHLGTVDGVDRIATLGERLVDAAEGFGAPVVLGVASRAASG